MSVAAAVIYDDSASHILISLRPADKHQGNLWEFPGGKIESGESALDALSRELKEELDIVPLSSEPLIVIEHNYPDKQVQLDVWRVWSFEGSPRGVEAQEIRWIPVTEVGRYDFPAANQKIVNAIANTGA